MVQLRFLGAAQTVTGSQYLVEDGNTRVMVDCGMFQGRKELRLRNWNDPTEDPASVKAVILTHTHLDHIGRLPRLVKRGFAGAVHATPPTAELAEILLKDAAHLQEEDARYLNRKGLTKHKPALPLFDANDVDATLKLFQPVPMGEEHKLDGGFSFSYRIAGHILGAASVALQTPEGNGRESRRVVFSGDLGRPDAILARVPEPLPESDYIVVESTYGNRSHAPLAVEEQLAGVIQRTEARGGVLLIPAFAVGRAQQMIYLIDKLVTEQQIRPMPVHLDSPMAVNATQIYNRFPDSHKVDLRSIGGRSILHGKWVHLCRSVQESKALNSLKGPAVIISSSGMLSGGRILHHCRVRLPHARNTLLITGYQAEGTLGRALLNGAHTARIHKGNVKVLAEVTSLKGLSAHADSNEIMQWLSTAKKPPRRVFVTHGEPEAAHALAARIERDLHFPTHVPAPGEVVELD